MECHTSYSRSFYGIELDTVECLRLSHGIRCFTDGLARLGCTQGSVLDVATEISIALGIVECLLESCIILSHECNGMSHKLQQILLSHWIRWNACFYRTRYGCFTDGLARFDRMEGWIGLRVSSETSIAPSTVECLLVSCSRAFFYGIELLDTVECPRLSHGIRVFHRWVGTIRSYGGIGLASRAVGALRAVIPLVVELLESIYEGKYMAGKH